MLDRLEWIDCRGTLAATFDSSQLSSRQFGPRESRGVSERPAPKSRDADEHRSRDTRRRVETVRHLPDLPDNAEFYAESLLPYNLPYKSRQLPSSGVVARLQHPCSDRAAPSGAVPKNPSGRIISAAL